MSDKDLQPLKICPITKTECTEDDCPAWLKLDDWEGCTLEFSLSAVRDVVTEGARLLDEIRDLLRIGR